VADRNLRIRMLLEAGDKATKPMRDIAAGSSRLSQSLRVTRDRLKDIERAQADVAGFRQLKSGLRSTEHQLGLAQTRVGQLAREMDQAGTPTKKLAADFAKAKKEAAQLTTQHAEESAELQRLRDRMRAAGMAAGGLVDHERDLRTAAARTTEEIEQQSRRLVTLTERQKRMARARESFGKVQGMATGLAAGGASGIATGMALGRPIIGGVEEAQAFQSGMTDIAQKANLTRVQADRMAAGLLIAARAANQMPDDLQKGVDALAGFGLDPRKAVEMMKPIGRAATAYKAEIADLSAAAFAANDNLKVPVAQTARVIDIMAQAGKSGAFEIKDMAGAFPSLTAAYQALGQKGLGAVADLSAAAQIARKGTGDSASAATNLENVIQKIASPATIKAFDKMGVKLPAALKKMYAEGKTPLEAIAELTNKTLKGDLGKLGFLFEDAQVQQGLRPLIQNMEEYRRIRAEAAGANGTTDKDFAERMKDSAEETRQLTVNAEALKVTLGTSLLPTVNAVTVKATALVERLSGWAQRNPALAKGVVMFAAGLAVLFAILGGFGILVAAIMGPIAILNAGLIAMGVAGGTATIGLLPIIGTVAAIVLGLAALAMVAYAIYSNWGGITAWFAGVWNGIKGIVSGTLQWFAALPARFAEFGRNMIAGIITGITSKLAALKATVVGAASGAANWFKRKLDINSPSRVFMGFGGFMMDGLSNGIAAGESEPVRRLDRLSKRMVSAIALGTAAPAMAVTPGAAGAAPSQQAAASRSAAPITINVYPLPGQDPVAIGEAVRKALEDERNQASAAQLSAFADNDEF